MLLNYAQCDIDPAPPAGGARHHSSTYFNITPIFIAQKYKKVKDNTPLMFYMAGYCMVTYSAKVRVIIMLFSPKPVIV